VLIAKALLRKDHIKQMCERGLTPRLPVQDALNFWERNKVEEGGGGYLAWNWDSSIWGADVLLAQQTTDTNYGAEVRDVRLCSARFADIFACPADRRAIGSLCRQMRALCTLCYRHTRTLRALLTDRHTRALHALLTERPLTRSSLMGSSLSKSIVKGWGGQASDGTGMYL
jgi:hypothetical protein